MKMGSRNRIRSKSRRRSSRHFVPSYMPYNPRMTHRRLKRKACVLVLLLFLAGGAIVNVAVAWGIASKTPRVLGMFIAGFGPFMPDNELESVFNRSGYEIAGYAAATVKRDRGSTIVSVRPGIRDAATDAELGSAVFADLGWPLLSLRDETWVRPAPRIAYGIELSMEHGQHALAVRSLPLMPIWPGFAINTIFYTAILALLFYGPGKVRRFVRVRRGRCPACAYPVGSSPICTECGNPVKAVSVESTS
jgi:hypothetical protein